MDTQRWLRDPWLQFAVFALLHAVARAPALVDAWWYLDDYAQLAGGESPLVRACLNGRPLEALWRATLWLDAGPGAAWANVALRAVQAGAHVLVALLGGRWLAAALGRPAVTWAALLFLLWPFHAEAVLWRTAGSYPLGALLAVLAVRTAWPRGEPRAGARRLSAAALLVVASAWMNQTGSLAVWVLPLAAVAAGARRLLAARPVVVMLGAHAFAALASVLITRMPAFRSERAALVTDPLAKLDLLLAVLGRLVAWPGLYPVVLAVCHLLLVGVAAVVACRRIAGVRRALAAAAVAVALAAAPFATLLAVRDSWAPFRTMYVGPWLLVAAACVASRCDGRPTGRARVRRLTVVSVVGVAIAAGIVVGRRHARGFVTVFRSEQRVLARAVEVAGPRARVFVEPAPAATVWNPFGVEVLFADSPLSALTVRWATRGRVEVFTRARLVDGPELRRAAARAVAAGAAADGFRVVRDPRSGVALILQPRHDEP